MPSRKSIQKSRRAEDVARESFRRFSRASWALSLAEGDEISKPTTAEVQVQLRAIFYAAGRAESAARDRVNLRNVAARYALKRITKARIPDIVARIRAGIDR